MMELVEVFLNVCGHGDATSPFAVVLIKGESRIEGASLVYRYGIQILESLDDMVSSFFADVFDTEVVYH